MEIIVAKNAGFCFGVKRAVDMVYAEAKKNNSLDINERKNLYTYGPIIHNEAVVNELKDLGVIVMEDNLDPASYPPGIVIIRSHGIKEETYEELLNAGHTILDATCPFVKKIHNIVKEASPDNNIIIIGNKDHPEVKGIMGYIKGEDVTVIDSREEAKSYQNKNGKKTVVVSQTTYNYKKFQELVEILKKKEYDINAVGTICSATEERQKEARSIARSADVMLVIGSKNSSNSKKLYSVCREKCKQTYFLQTADDILKIPFSELPSIKKIGIAAGASTPNNIIKEVQNNVSGKF